MGQDVQPSPTPLFFSSWLFFPHPRPTWQPKISTTEGSWRERLSCADTNTPQLMDSRALLCSENKTHTHTLWLCKSYECRSIGSISPSFRCVRLFDGSLGMLCVCVEGSHVGELVDCYTSMWTSLCHVDMFLLNSARFVLFVVFAVERWTIFLRDILRCCYVWSLKSKMS